MKQKGFTLIELLAVIVILAIIALIATPIVLNIISESKESATLQSAEFYLGAVETAVAQKIIDDPTFRPETCGIQKDGNLKCNNGTGGTTDVKVEINGEKPTSGTINLKNGQITKVQLVLNEKTITKNTEGKLVYGEPEVQLESGLYDEEGNLIVSWDELVKAGINLEKDVVPQFDENDEITNLSEFPGVILSNDEKLKQGTKLVIDSSITKIGYGALVMNTSLKEVIIPNSVTSIGGSAFDSCESLTSVNIPNSVTSIGDFAFAGCTSLTEIVIPNSVTSIGRGAFSSCSSLIEITIPNSVISIGEDAFSDCSSLKSITISNSVTIIETSTFYGCESLETITIPNSVTSFGKESFDGCSNLKTINYTGTTEQWDAIAMRFNLDNHTPTNKVINYNYVIPQN